MKKALIILLCWVSLGYPDTKFISANTGNDSNSGNDFANAWLTLGKAVTDGQAAGDTIVCEGEFDEQLTPTADGTSGSKIVWIDSVRFTDGFSATLPDTSWGAIIDRNGSAVHCFNSTNDDFHNFIGFEFEGGTVANVIWNLADGLLFWQCKFDPTGDAGSSHISISNGTVDSVISCVFISSSEIANGSAFGANGTNPDDGIYIVNNTVYGNFKNDNPLEINGSGGWTVLNNLLQNIHSGAGNGYVVSIGTPASTVSNFNNNLFYQSGGKTDWFIFNGTAGSTIAAWEDSVNNYDGDGATNSLNTDPSLQSVNTTAFILNTSAAFEAGTDLGYGDDIGYFQIAAAAVTRRKWKF